MIILEWGWFPALLDKLVPSYCVKCFQWWFPADLQKPEKLSLSFRDRLQAQCQIHCPAPPSTVPATVPWESRYTVARRCLRLRGHPCSSLTSDFLFQMLVLLCLLGSSLGAVQGYYLPSYPTYATAYPAYNTFLGSGSFPRYYGAAAIPRTGFSYSFGPGYNFQWRYDHWSVLHYHLLLLTSMSSRSPGQGLNFLPSVTLLQEEEKVEEIPQEVTQQRWFSLPSRLIIYSPSGLTPDQRLPLLKARFWSDKRRTETLPPTVRLSKAFVLFVCHSQLYDNLSSLVNWSSTVN